MDREEYDVLNSVLDAEVSRFVEAMGPDTDAVFEEMASANVDDGVPIVGPEVGATLRIIARMTGATRAFEFGSGRGYSGYWIAPVIPTDGDLVLTDFDAENMDAARSHFERGGYADRTHFEVGDALETYRRYEGPWDLVLIDNLEGEYVETLELVRDDLAPGGVLFADNVMAGPAVDGERALAALEGAPEWESMDDSTRGVVEYLLAVRDDDAFETALLPVGEGLAVSVKR